jgi:hypothetical protein
MNISVITLTIMFIVLTLPGTVVTILSDDLLLMPGGYMFISIADSLDFLFHACNFIILLITNKRFSDETREVLAKIGILKPNSNVKSSTSNQRN